MGAAGKVVEGGERIGASGSPQAGGGHAGRTQAVGACARAAVRVWQSR
jgi:hypothetical protein